MPSVRSGAIAPSPEPATYFMLIDGLNGGSTDRCTRAGSRFPASISILRTLLLIRNADPPTGQTEFLVPERDPAKRGGACRRDGSRRHRRARQRCAHRGVHRRHDARPRSTSSPSPMWRRPRSPTAKTAATACLSTTARSRWSRRTEAGTQTTQFSYDIDTNTDGAFNPSSLALSPDSSGGPVTPAKYFLALDGVKGDSLDANHKGWFEVSDFDFDLGQPIRWGPRRPRRPPANRLSRR